MKTVNVSIPDEVWRQARIESARHNTTLSGLVRGYLKAMVEGRAPVLLDSPDGDADRLQREELVAALQATNLVLGYQPSRDRTYER